MQNVFQYIQSDYYRYTGKIGGGQDYCLPTIQAKPLFQLQFLATIIGS